jgi:uncharacterized protein YndB with AHSA1/START domain
MDFDPRSSAPVNLTQYFPVPADTVFAAWTEPEIMRRWLFVSATSEIRKIDLDLRVGGTFSILAWSGREFIDHFGAYQKVAPPHNLAFTLQVPKHFPGVSEVIVAVMSTPDGCVMDFQQTGVARETTESAWQVMFATLADVLVA